MKPVPVPKICDRRMKGKKMKKIIIFGATGNVGSYVTKYAAQFFKEKDYEVIGQEKYGCVRTVWSGFCTGGYAE